MQGRIYIYKSRFFYLLLTFIIYIIAVANLSGTPYNNFFVSAIFSFFVIFGVYAVTNGSYLKFINFILVIASLLMHWILLSHLNNEKLHIASAFINITLLITISYSVLNNVTGQKQVTADTLMGAICGYLLLGLTWTFIYLLIAHYNHAAFSGSLLTISVHQNVQHFLYFSFTTMTTLGYGDILPLSNMARTCAWLEAVSGQIYLAVWISELVGLRIAQRIDLLKHQLN